MDNLNSSRHVAALDGLRGCAALAVTMFHALLHYNTALIERVLYAPASSMSSASDLFDKFYLSIFNGDAPVILFFVLSGFVLAASVDRSLDKGKTIGFTATDFLVRRVLRIYPAMFGCMALYWAIYLLTRGLIVYPAVNLEVFFKSSTLYDITIHGPSWSLLVEMIAAPFVLVFVILRRQFGFFALILIAAYAMMAIDYPALVWHLPNFWAYLISFVIGIAIASPQMRSIRFDVKPWHMAAALLAFIFARSFVPRAGISGLIAQSFLAGLVVFVAARLDTGRIFSFLTSKPILQLGKISYSFYLLNVPILYLVWGIVDKYVANPGANNHLWGIGAGLVAVAITIPLSVLSERYVEQPGVRLGKAIMSWRPMTPRAAA